MTTLEELSDRIKALENNVGKKSGGPLIQDFRKKLRDSLNSQQGLTKEQAEKSGICEQVEISYPFLKLIQ